MGSKRGIYPNLRAELARNNLSIAKVAKLMGISRTALYNKLNGLTSFTLKDITTIQEILKANDSSGDYTLEYLFLKTQVTA